LAATFDHSPPHDSIPKVRWRRLSTSTNNQTTTTTSTLVKGVDESFAGSFGHHQSVAGDQARLCVRCTLAIVVDMLRMSCLQVSSNEMANVQIG
ncbi:hypothetical protein T4E_5943, partial [Trichinella pseudospiralis]